MLFNTPDYWKYINSTVHSPHRTKEELPILKDIKFPKRFLFFDTETHIVDPTIEGSPMDFKVGCAIFVEYRKDYSILKRQIYTYHSIDEFISIVESLDRKKKKLYLIAHNIKFDMQVLDIPIKLWVKGYKLEPPIMNGITFLWYVKAKRGSIQFLDTANYVPRTLDSIGKDLGFPKLEVDFETVPIDELITLV